MEKQISILIPTYNMEKYLNKCLDSLLIPELDEVEVLVVNDGSKDRSSEIAHEYERKYPNSFRVIDKENGNYGSCVNRGIKEAKGKYIKILDADDTFDKYVLKKTVYLLKDLDVDVILTDYDIVNENGIVTKSIRFDLDKDIRQMPFDSVVESLTNNSQMHSLMYRTDYIRSLNYHQTEGISYTDTEWNFIPLACANSYSYLPAGSLYKYLVGRDGQTMDPAIFHKKLGDQFIVLLSRANNIESHSHILSNERVNFLINSFLMQAHYIYLSVISSKNKTSKISLSNFENELKNISKILFDKIGVMNYTPSYHYKFVEKFRASKNPELFNIPLLHRLIRIIKGGLNRIV